MSHLVVFSRTQELRLESIERPVFLMAALVERAEGLLIGRKFPVCINTAHFQGI